MTLKRLAEIITELIIFDDPLYICNKDANFPYLFSVELDRYRWEISYSLLRAENYVLVDMFGNISSDCLYYDEQLWKYGIDLYSEDWRFDPESASSLIDRVEYFIDNLSTIKDMIKELKGDIDEAE